MLEFKEEDENDFSPKSGRNTIPDIIHNSSTVRSHHYDSKVQDLDQSPNDPNYAQPKTSTRMGDTNLIFDETPVIEDFKL